MNAQQRFSLSTQRTERLAIVQDVLQQLTASPESPVVTVGNFVVPRRSWDELLNLVGDVDERVIDAYLRLSQKNLPVEARLTTRSFKASFFKQWMTRLGSGEPLSMQDYGFALSPPTKCVIVPAKISDTQWALGCVWVDSANEVEIGVYDFGQEDRQASRRFLALLRKWVVAERCDPTKAHLYGPHFRSDISIMTNLYDRPKQEVWADSGVLLAATAVWITEMGGRGQGDLLHGVFNAQGVSVMRERMAYDLARFELNRREQLAGHAGQAGDGVEGETGQHADETGQP